MTDVIPGDAKQFILKNIDSIAQWEGLLLMRASPDKRWDANTFARDLYIAPDEAARLLRQLHGQGFLEADASSSDLYRYHPSDPESDAMIARVAELYALYLIPITRLIHAKPKTRIQEFADAFRIRKD